MIRGIKFIGIPVSNQDVALKFYTESLGMKVLTDQPFTPTQRWIELTIPGADSGLALFTPPGREDQVGKFQSRSPRPNPGERPRFSKTPTETSSSFQAMTGRNRLPAT
jgi:catechol 2,3-dioxygenase-like lactoylglutathione lyase family enzyme